MEMLRILFQFQFIDMRDGENAWSFKWNEINIYFPIFFFFVLLLTVRVI